MQSSPSLPAVVEVGAGDDLRESIYRVRHEVYALEIGQHSATTDGRLTDVLDEANHYLAVTVCDELEGFVSITPPGDCGYSIDKYFRRAALPFDLDPTSFELRLLTVLPKFWGSKVAAVLMLAAFRWIESRGGSQIVVIGRREIKDIYRKAGLQEVGLSVDSGAVSYDLMHGNVKDIRRQIDFSFCSSA